MPDRPETMKRAELVTRSGRDLSDDDIELLVALGIVEPTPIDLQLAGVQVLRLR